MQYKYYNFNTTVTFLFTLQLQLSNFLAGIIIYSYNITKPKSKIIRKDIKNRHSVYRKVIPVPHIKLGVMRLCMWSLKISFLFIFSKLFYLIFSTLFRLRLHSLQAHIISSTFSVFLLHHIILLTHIHKLVEGLWKWTVCLWQTNNLQMDFMWCLSGHHSFQLVQWTCCVAITLRQRESLSVANSSSGISSSQGSAICVGTAACLCPMSADNQQPDYNHLSHIVLLRSQSCMSSLRRQRPTCVCVCVYVLCIIYWKSVSCSVIKDHREIHWHVSVMEHYTSSNIHALTHTSSSLVNEKNTESPALLCSNSISI